MDENYGTLTISVHVIERRTMVTLEGEGPAEYHRRVVVYRRYSLTREQADVEAARFRDSNPGLHQAGLIGEWVVKEGINLI